MTVIPFRSFGGRFASRSAAVPTCTPAMARRVYETWLVAVCRHQGLRPNAVKAQLARPGRPNFDPQWRAAAYARQLALYLANTEHCVPQKLLAEVAGITPAAVCLALQAIEDVRENRAFDRAVDAVAAAMEMRP
jgi:hypothetical protein